MRELLIDAIKEINKDLEIKDLENIKDETPLFDILDSMAILDLVLEIENRLQQKYSKYIQIADDKTMDALNTPFKTFKILLEYVEGKVNG
jgi:acyl carrier protein